MYFLNKIKKLSQDKTVRIYVDMDGVIADYDFGSKLLFLNKRPIMTNIKTLREIAKLPNVSLYILSICRKDEDIADKNSWLDKYAPFFDLSKRIIISKNNKNKSSKKLKLDYLNSLNTNDLIIVIDDDNAILKYLKDNLKDIMYFQDSSIID